MPTDFTIASECVTIFEKDILSLSNYSKNDKTKILNFISEITNKNKILNTYFSKFQKRIESGLYNENMKLKVENLITRSSICQETLNNFILINQSSDNEEEEVKVFIEENNNANLPEPPLLSVKSKLDEDVTILVDDLPPKKIVKEEKIVEELPINIIQYITEKDIEEIENSNYITDEIMNRSYSYEIAQSLILAVCKSMDLDTTKEFTRESLTKLLYSMQISRMKMEIRDENGWKKWAEIESRAAFILIDTDKSGTVSLDEFIHFAKKNPLMFGPLFHIERLFQSYDSNHDGFIDSEELYNLLLEVEIELSSDAPDTDQIALKARQYIYHYDSDKNGALDFLEFSKLIFTHPELLGTAIMLRSYFTDADKDGNGTLDKNEMSQMMKSFMKDSGYQLPSEKEFQEYIDKIMIESDKNEDGFIDYTEFVAFVLRKDTDIPLFQILISNSQDVLYHDPFGNSFLHRLISESKNALNLTDPNQPEFNTCGSCNAPLVGQMGVERHSIIFCSTSCVSRCSHLAELRAEYLSKFGSNSRGFHKAARTH